MFNYYVKCIKNYVNFSGRARGKELWMFLLCNIVIQLVFWLLIPVIGLFSTVILGLYSLFVFLPNLAVIVRRLHDLGKGGGWIFIVLVPVVGQIWFFVLMLTAGENGPNRFGPDPRAEDAACNTPQ